MSDEKTKRFIWIGGAIAVSLLACVLCVGTGTGWWLGISGSPNLEIPGAGTSKGSMTFQELQERLNAGGLKVTRISSGRRGVDSMWFGEGFGEGFGGELCPLKDVDGANIDAFDQAGVLWERNFVVTKTGSEKDALTKADGIKDVAQTPAFAWGPFVFQGRQQNLDAVKKALGLRANQNPVGTGHDLKKKLGAIRVTPTYDKGGFPIKIGSQRMVIVHIERIDYEGPVTVRLIGLPTGVSAAPLVIQANSDKGQIPFATSFGTPPLTVPIRVVAESANGAIRAEEKLELKIIK